MLCATAHAQEFDASGLRYRVTAPGEVAVAPLSHQEAVTAPYQGIVIVPQQVHYAGANYLVTAVADSAFMQSQVTEVQLPNTVTSLGREAFAYATQLESLTLPLQLQELGTMALAGTAVENIAVPEGVAAIGWGAFQSCPMLHTALLPSTLTKIDAYGFNNCHNLAEIYCAAPTPPDASAWAVFIGLEDIDVIVPDDEAVAAYAANSVWGNDTTFTLYPNEDLDMSMSGELEPYNQNWMRVTLGNNLAYRIYDNEGELLALTAASHYYLPVLDHDATYTIVPTTMMGDAEAAEVTVPSTTGINRVIDEVERKPVIYGVDGVLFITGDNYGTWTRVWDMYGQLYYQRPSGGSEVIELPHNRVYIVMVGNTVQKIFL